MIGDEDVVVSAVVNEVAVMRFAGRIVGKWSGVGPGIGGAGKTGEDGRLDGKCEGGGMGKGPLTAWAVTVEFPVAVVAAAPKMTEAVAPTAIASGLGRGGGDT